MRMQADLLALSDLVLRFASHTKRFVRQTTAPTFEGIEMNHELFLMRVMHRTGIARRGVAEDVIRHVVTRLSPWLDEASIQEIQQHLPEPVARWLVHLGDGEPYDLDSLYHSVAEQLDAHVSFGLEFTQVVCQVIGEATGPVGRDLLRGDLPKAWHPLFEPRKALLSPTSPRQARGRSLATASPGSTRPLSQAQPGHLHSLARNESPREGIKLSSSHGKADDRTLAAGRPGSSRSIEAP